MEEKGLGYKGDSHAFKVQTVQAFIDGIVVCVRTLSTVLYRRLVFRGDVIPVVWAFSKPRGMMLFL